MAGTTCDRCGFKPKNPGASLYFSAQRSQTVCVSAAACKKRRDRKPQYDWRHGNPGFEAQMST